MHTSLAVIGAGPYGLSIAAHAQAAGIPYVLFGEPMQFWKTTMLDDMLLRSPVELTSLSHPDERLSLPTWMEAHGMDPDSRAPVAKDLFLAYVADFQEQAGVAHHNAWVTALQRDGERFVLTTERETRTADHVVMATGLMHYPAIPTELRESLPAERYSHTSDFNPGAVTDGQRVLVIGGGQSAFEAALAAAGAGATVTLAQRDSSIYYADIHQLLSRMFVSLLSNSPSVFHYLPDGWHDTLRRRMLPTTVAPWIKPMLADQGVTVWCDATLETAQLCGAGIDVRFADGRMIEVDHIIAGTGYRVDLDRHPLLTDPSIRDAIEVHTGMPHLDRHYQSTLPGLFFAGAMAMHSFGPAYNFIFGVSPQCRAMIDDHLAPRSRETR